LIVESRTSLFLVGDDDGSSTLLNFSRSGTFTGQQYDWHKRKVLITDRRIIVTDGTPDGTSRIYRTISDDTDTLRMFHTAKRLFFELAPSHNSPATIHQSDGVTSDPLLRASC